MSPAERDQILQALDREVIPRLTRIEEQVRRTNGRVDALEAERDRRNGYEARQHEERASTDGWLNRLVPATFAVVIFVCGVLLAHYWPV